MTITLRKDHEELLRQAVVAGQFATVEDAVAFAIEHFLPGDLDDLAWAKPDVDAARAEIDSGEHDTIASYRAKLRERQQRLAGK